MNTTKITFKNKNPNLLFVFGVGFFLAGVIAVATGNLLGLIFCVLSILFFRVEGSEIELETNQYRKFTAVFGLRVGTWKELPKIAYISVFRTTETIIVKDFTGQSEMTDEIITINLFYNGNHRIKAYKTKDKADAFKVAKQIAERLKIDILDATEAESKWI